MKEYWRNAWEMTSIGFFFAFGAAFGLTAFVNLFFFIFGFPEHAVGYAT